jgi:hypothetical protein
MLLVALLIAATLTLPGTPAAADIGCGDPSRTDIACPDDPDTAEFIVSVTSTPVGVSILLTDAGVDAGRSCEGAARIVRMASDLYARLPPDQRLRDDLLWANPTITREVFAHAWGASLGIDNGNPVDIVFADYLGESSSIQGAVWGGPLNAAIRCSGD